MFIFVNNYFFMQGIFSFLHLYNRENIGSTGWNEIRAEN
jgi:hypothetical protein